MVHSSKNCKFIRKFSNKIASRKNKESRNADSIINQEVNSMMKKSVEQAMKYNLDKN